MLIDARKTFAFLSAFYMRTWLLKIIPSKSTLSLTFACFASLSLKIFPLVPSALACTVTTVVRESTHF